MVLTLLVACSAPADTGLVGVEDTSFPGIPTLQAVSATCEADVVTYRARTIGWTSNATVDVWALGPEPQDHEGFTLPTVGFRRDEYCDLLQVVQNAADAAAPDATLTSSEFTCEQFATNQLTFLFQVWFEEGCAGGAVFGADPESVYSDSQTVHPEPTMSSDGTCVPENADDPLMPQGTITDEVPDCTESWP